MMLLTREAVLYKVFLCGAVFIPLLVIPFGEGGVGYVDFMVLLLPFLFFIAPPVNFCIFHYFLFFFLGVCFISLLSIEVDDGFIESLIRWVRLIGIFFPLVIACCVKKISENRVLAIIYYSWIANMVSVLIALAMFFTGFEWMEQSQMLWIGNEKFNRMGGLVGNTGVFAASLYIFFALSIHLFSAKKISLMLFCFSSALVVSSIILSSSRMGLLTTLVVLVTYLYFSGMVSIKTILYFCGAISFVLPLTYFLVSIVDKDFLMHSLARFSIGSEGVQGFSSGRINNWHELMQNISSYFFLGVGYKNGDAVAKFIDNSYLRILVETGFFGLLSYLGIYLSIVWVTFKKSMGKREKSLSYSLVAALLVSGMTSDVYTFWTTTPIVFLIVSAILLKNTANKQGYGYDTVC